MYSQLFSKSGLSLERLRTLCEVAEAGGIAKAAPGDPDRQSLYCRQIKELEGFFGTDLVRRKGRGIEITPEGDRIAAAAREYFHKLEDILAHTRREAVGFHVAAANSILEWIVIPRLAGFTKKLGRVRFHFSDLRSADIVAAVREHRADFGIVRANMVGHPLKARSMGRMGYRVFAPAGCRETQSMPWALPAGLEFRAAIGKSATAAGVRMEAVFECQSFSQCAGFVREGVAVAILPEFASPYLPGCPSFQPEWLAQYQREITLVWRDRVEDLRPMAREVAAVLLGTLARQRAEAA